MTLMVNAADGAHQLFRYFALIRDRTTQRGVEICSTDFNRDLERTALECPLLKDQSGRREIEWSRATSGSITAGRVIVAEGYDACTQSDCFGGGPVF